MCVWVASPLVAQSMMRSQLGEDSRSGSYNSATFFIISLFLFHPLVTSLCSGLISSLFLCVFFFFFFCLDEDIPLFLFFFLFFCNLLCIDWVWGFRGSACHVGKEHAEKTLKALREEISQNLPQSSIIIMMVEETWKATVFLWLLFVWLMCYLAESASGL